MNTAVRRVGLAVVVLLLALVGQLTYLQVVDAKKLADDPRNFRASLKNFNQPRGQILSADGKILARSVKTTDGDAYKFQRVYPFGSLMAQTVGYQSVNVGNVGMESSYNSVLNGDRHPKLNLQDLGGLLIGTRETANVVSSLRTDVQAVARNVLGSDPGSIVVMDPRSGAVIAMYSNPTFDPQPLAGHDGAKVNADFFALTHNPANPALPRAYREIFPPGSTFKIVTTASGLETPSLGLTPQTEFGTFFSFTPPQTDKKISNFNNQACGGTLENSFVHSCNVTFARLGFELGENFPPHMANFGVFSAPPIDLDPGAVASQGPEPGTFEQNKPSFALAGIGQGKVFTTPLQMAMVAGAVADDGMVMTPHVGACIQAEDGRVLEKIAPKPWKRAMTPATATTLSGFMQGVVQSGTGRAAQIDGVAVAGKTGTAQKEGQTFPEAWFVGFAPANPASGAQQYVVAVLLEHTTAGDRAQGGVQAAPRAKQLLEYLLAHPSRTLSASCSTGG